MVDDSDWLSGLKGLSPPLPTPAMAFPIIQGGFVKTRRHAVMNFPQLGWFLI
jgi:hypothetical protein